jgi:hypothetical protein
MMSPTILLSPSPLALSTITLRGNAFDTGRLRILPVAAPRWSRAILRANMLHLQETEDGQPRRVTVNNQVARIAPAPCRALLADHSLRSPLGVGADVCSECKMIAELVHGRDWAGFL